MNANGEACTAAQLDGREVARSGASSAPPGRNVEQRRAGAAFARLVRRHGDAAIAARLSVGPRADARPRCGRSCSRRRTKRSRRSIAATSTSSAASSATCVFQCVFQAQIAAEAGRFAMADVLDAITAKLIRRHPHVFTPDGRPLAARRRGAAKTPTAVLEQWEQIKAKEQTAAGAKTRLLSGVPRVAAGAAPRARDRHARGRRRLRLGAHRRRRSTRSTKRPRELREALATEPSARGRGIRRPALLHRESGAQAQHRARVRAPRGQRQVHVSLRGARRSLRARGHGRSTAPRSTRWTRRVDETSKSRRSRNSRSVGESKSTSSLPITTSRLSSVQRSPVHCPHVHALAVGLDRDRAVEVRAKHARAELRRTARARPAPDDRRDCRGRR